MKKLIVIAGDEDQRKEIENNTDLIEDVKYQTGAEEVEYHKYDENDVTSMLVMKALGDFSVPILATVEDGRKVCKVNLETANTEYCAELGEGERIE
jgi:hypothetical protein